MGLPFQGLSPLGWSPRLFCAAKGCSIQTFDLGGDPRPLFSWTHPSFLLLRQNQISRTKEALERGSPEGEGLTAQQPPSKRRKLGSDDDDDGGDGGGGGDGDAAETNAEVEETMKTGPNMPTNGEKKKNQKKSKARSTLPAPEVPLVVLLTATADGSHVIAVTGQDKTLWVFEHDGKGALAEVSRRAMPKRPCSLALTADGRTILSADKFGDVYALPLVPEEQGGCAAAPTPGSTSASASASAPPSSPAPPQPLRGANVFTVHSQRNRRALEDQQRQREANNNNNNNARRDQPKAGPAFAHELLLGHVSMLTSVLAARDARGRPYIVTADRDEHIRVSRGAPQAHVVETFCLGHGAFVSALCIPASRPAVLVSGGGDDELFAWDWLAGRLLCTVDLLARVREVQPDATKIAVTKLVAFEMGGGGPAVVAVCERVPALFVFQLETGDTLSHRETIPLRGNPLDAAMVAAEKVLLVAIDPAGGGDEICVFERGCAGEQLLTPREPIRGTAGAEAEPSLSRDDLDKALYTVENLRKTGNDEGGGGGEEAAPETHEAGSETRQE